MLENVVEQILEDTPEERQICEKGIVYYSFFAIYKEFTLWMNIYFNVSAMRIKV